MKRVAAVRGLIAAGLLAGAGLALGNDTGTTHLASDPEVVEILSGIDFVPQRDTLDEVMGAGAAQDLIDLARDLEGEVDIGIRIRAYRALAHYPQPATAAALEAAVFEHAGAVSGSEVLLLRAAMHSLALVAGPDAVDAIAPRLNHSKRDVRAAAARALGETGAGQAARDLLLARRFVEEESQVILAIDEALRQLTT
jgi:HEAT repeat protein